MKKPFIILGTVEQVLEVVSNRITPPENPNVKAGETTNNHDHFRIDDDMMVLIPLSVFARCMKVPIEDLTKDIFLDVFNSMKETTGIFPIRELEVDE